MRTYANAVAELVADAASLGVFLPAETQFLAPGENSRHYVTWGRQVREFSPGGPREIQIWERPRGVLPTFVSR